MKKVNNSAIIGRIRSLIQGSVFALQTFNVLRFASFFLVSVLLVKIPLDVDQIADYEYVLFLSSIVTGWWIHGFLQSYMADSVRLDDIRKGHLFRDYSRLYALPGSVILILIAVIIEVLSRSEILQNPPIGFYYFLIFHFILHGCILIAYYFHQRNWHRGIYFLAVWFFLAYVGSFSMLLVDGVTLPRVYSWLVLLSLPIVVVWIYLYITSGTSIAFTPKKSYWPQLSILMLIQGIGFLSLWSDGFWVQYFYGTGEIFALFRYGGREFPLFVILTTTFSIAVIQEARTPEGWERIHDTSRRYIPLFLTMAIGLMLTSQYLFGWVYNESFVPASFIFDMYLLLIIVRVLFPRPILIAHRYYKSLLLISVGELLINLVLSFTFYWVWGLMGLILGSLAAHLFEMGTTIYLVRSKLKIPVRQFIPIRYYLVFTVVLMMVFTLKYALGGPEWLGNMITP